MDCCRKLFVYQLLKSMVSADSFVYGSLSFRNVWLQGVLIITEGQAFLDDGTGLVRICDLHLFKDLVVETGMYVMILGEYCREDDQHFILTYKFVDLSAFPDRESMWRLEVMDVFNFME